MLEPGDVVVAMTDLKQDAPILGSAGIIPEGGRYLHNQRIGKVTMTDPTTLVPDFVPWLLNSPHVRTQVRATATGATVRHTAPTRMCEIVTTIPPSTIQKKISMTLGAFDDLIQINERRIELLEDLVRSLYREWFARFRAPSVASEPGEVTDGWEPTDLGSIATRYSGGTPSTKNDARILGRRDTLDHERLPSDGATDQL